ncbi:lipid droplet-associated protein [Amycolatopsis pithecellobii]|uniref:Lipid droplet-associated protein n=1 Tax=Amycolatopsis pithecellobii TaxID=664692 RepID=A0A6N7YQM3_9PSEU|nr:lipid droplet-associated protein [Amycolatopsis pithecellobii]MTD54198.1 lipid droplet-associated protein [Amycolatopsis pithecellobii]
MKPLPLPLRVAAGLAVTAAERARELPKNLVGLPVTVVSHVLQFSMRVQQHVTELAIKGDGALSALRPTEETPSWATFDEDLPPSPGHNGHQPAPVAREVADSARDPWEQEERALAEDHTEGEFDSVNGTQPVVTETGEVAGLGASGPEGLGIEPAGLAGLANYDELSLPQLRARLRRFTLDELEELLTYERTHENRPSFVGMLARRISNIRRLSEGDNGAGGQ